MVSDKDIIIFFSVIWSFYPLTIELSEIFYLNHVFFFPLLKNSIECSYVDLYSGFSGHHKICFIVSVWNSIMLCWTIIFPAFSFLDHREDILVATPPPPLSFFWKNLLVALVIFTSLFWHVFSCCYQRAIDYLHLSRFKFADYRQQWNLLVAGLFFRTILGG